ncbi:hypothetical protein EX30DRAFT_15016 [Ascodesmis nigricans]|uniref:Uncharacterized protein n=1 Tax=Ascodesmis nigricans TaxID=341454 RepID=A0A4S2N6X1_9PEZI|nr:hypothetical protein EX30DRAFT_15016 [Ascodesmis nigricans]
MPADPKTLYGTPRPKSKPITLSSTSIQSLSTELALARSQLSTTKSTPARPRTTKSSSKSSIFKSKNPRVDVRAQKDILSRTKHVEDVRHGEPISEREWEKRKRRLQEKARVYEKLKRGEVEDDGAGGAGGSLTLVDFDRKWAEREKSGGSRYSDDEKDEEEEEEEEEAKGDQKEEVVEYVDEFGRTRKATKSAIEKERRDAERDAEASVRPQAPAEIIRGDTIQTHAFQTPEFYHLPRKGELEALLPTEEEEEKDLEAHYDASKEVRTKGVGFFQFSTDNKERRREMEELEKERERTAQERKEKEERRKRKREELEKRKEEVKRKKREKVGGSWLDKFEGELEGLR